MMRAPCTGPWTGRASSPCVRSSSAEPAAAAGLCARKATVGPEPETSPGDRAAGLAQSQDVAQARGPARWRPRCRSLTRTRLRASASPLTQGLQDRPGPPAAGSSARPALRRPQPVQARHRPSGWTGRSSAGTRTQSICALARAGEMSPDAQPDGGSAEQRERHVRAELRGQLGQFVAGQAAVPERVAGQQGGGGVGRTAAHAAGDGHALGDVQVHAGGVAGDFGHDRPRPCRPGCVHRAGCPRRRGPRCWPG